MNQKVRNKSSEKSQNISEIIKHHLYFNLAYQYSVRLKSSALQMKSQQQINGHKDFILMLEMSQYM